MLRTRHWVCCDQCSRVSEGYQIHEPGWLWITEIKITQAQPRNGGYELKEFKPKSEYHFCSHQCMNRFLEKQLPYISTQEETHDEDEKYAS